MISLFENTPIDMAQRYNNMVLVFLLTIMYAPLAPIVIVFGIVGATFSFWIEKVCYYTVMLTLVPATETLSCS